MLKRFKSSFFSQSISTLVQKEIIRVVAGPLLCRASGKVVRYGFEASEYLYVFSLLKVHVPGNVRRKMLLNEIAACVKRMVAVPTVGLKDALSCPSCVYDTCDEVEQLLCFSKTAAMLKYFCVQREHAVLRVILSGDSTVNIFRTWRRAKSRSTNSLVNCSFWEKARGQLCHPC